MLQTSGRCVLGASSGEVLLSVDRGGNGGLVWVGCSAVVAVVRLALARSAAERRLAGRARPHRCWTPIVEARALAVSGRMLEPSLPGPTSGEVLDRPTQNLGNIWGAEK